MTKIRYWQGVGLCGLAAFSLGAVGQEAAPKWGPHIDFEAKPGSKRTLGEADLFLPISQNDSTLVFANLRGRFDNQSSREGNLGLGVRHMLESGWNLGAYGYADRRRSPDSGYYYNQTTLGAEALGQDWDFRANTYLPRGTRVRELSTSTIVGIPTAALVGTTVQVTTPGNITTTREEHALKGYDMEAGGRAPIFDSDAAHQLRFFIGGYRFSDDTVTVKGPRVRAELAMDDLNWFGKGTRLFLGLEAQHDGARGHQSFLSVRLRIPLGRESASSHALSAQERRMTTPVMRDVDIVTTARTASTTAPTLVETATATAGGTAITVIDSATTSGAALAGAVAAAGNNSMVILSGTFNATNAPVTLQTGQTVMGVGSLTVRSPSGRTATLTTQGATLNVTTNVTGGAVNMAANSTLSGMTINQSYGGGVTALLGVTADTVDNVTITNNTITISGGSSGAVGVRILGASSGNTISGNTITVTNTNGNATALIMSGHTNVERAVAMVSGNSFSAVGTLSSYAAQLSNTTILSGSTGNVKAAGGCSIPFNASGNINFTDNSTCP